MLAYPTTPTEQEYPKRVGYDLFPDFVINNIAYQSLPKYSEWESISLDLIIYCKEHNINRIVIYDDVEYTYDISDIDWKLQYQRLPTWDPMDNVGMSCGTISKIQDLIYFLSTTDILPKQIFLSNKGEYPPQDNGECVQIIRERNLKIYAHGPFTLNLANPFLGGILKKHLILAKKLGISGFVVHCGAKTDKTEEVAIENMKRNIRDAIGPDCCKLILETSSGKGSEVLTNYISFINFVKEMNISICVDSCHVFDANYDPYYFLRRMISEQIDVALIHYNDSKNNWGSNKDRHEIIGEGNIPWISLDKFKKLAYMYQIPMVTEY